MVIANKKWKDPNRWSTIVMIKKKGILFNGTNKVKFQVLPKLITNLIFDFVSYNI